MTSILIIFEMTGGYGLILPLMISNMTAYALARHFRPVPIYDALLEQDGIHLPHRGARPPHALESLSVASAMTSDPFLLSAKMKVVEALEHASRQDFSTFPVVGEGGEFVGLTTSARLRRAEAEGAGALAVADFVRPCTHVFPDQPLVEAVVLMSRDDARQLVVLSRDDGARLAGLLTMSDIVRAHAQAAQSGKGSNAELNEVKPQERGRHA
jgi:CIC family chloride channel protein